MSDDIPSLLLLLSLILGLNLSVHYNRFIFNLPLMIRYRFDPIPVSLKVNCINTSE